MPLPTEEQVMLRDLAHSWAQKDSPVRAFRTMRDEGHELGFDPSTLSTVAEMGWTGTVIPDAYGGSDVGYLSMGVVLEELGRTLVAVPLLGSAVGAATALTLTGSDTQKSQWLPQIADGSAVGALAVDETSRYNPETIGFRADATQDGFSLSGTKTLVHDGMAADILVVAARTAGEPTDANGITLFAVPAGTAGISRERRHLVDHRGYADITFDNVQVGAAAVLGEVGGGRVALDRVLDCTTVMAAAEARGVAAQAFDTTLEYLKTRVQFGQLIGAFQALQHRAAKMYTEIQLARPCLDEAMHALDEEAPDAPALVSLAKTTVNELVHLISREMVQMHGGIGMTDAHDAGFYLKRARALEAAFGTAAYHRERYGRLNGL